MDKVTQEIEEMVHRETRAWDTQDLDLLMGLFHPDVVWPWPPHPLAHDPAGWVLELGRFHHERWRAGWQRLFETHRLIHNRRSIEKIVVSREGDGAFAVVDIDTLWQDDCGHHNHWKGRACKVYTRMSDGWKLIMHTGVLDYSRCPQS